MIVTRMRMARVFNGRRRRFSDGRLMMMASMRANRCSCCRSRRGNEPTWILASMTLGAVILYNVMPTVTGCDVQPCRSMSRSDQAADKHNEGGSDQRAHGAIRVESSEMVKWSDQGLLMRLVRYGAAFCSSSCEMFPNPTTIQFPVSVAFVITEVMGNSGAATA